jgi:nitric oxide synthase-interacting protein
MYRPDGYIYEKEAILECLLAQKREIKRKQKEYERLVAQHRAEAAEAVEVAQAARVAAFAAAETSIASAVASPFTSGSGSGGAAAAAGPAAAKGVDGLRVVPSLDTLPSQMVAEPLKTASGRQKAALPSFWLPSNTPEAKAALPAKPDDVTRCPMSQQPLALRDLTDVHFTEADPTSAIPLISRPVQWAWVLLSLPFQLTLHALSLL